MNVTNNRANHDKSQIGIMLTSILFGLMSAAGGAFAQEAGQRSSQHGTESTVLSPAGIADDGKLLDEADSLIKNGMPADAYALLEPLEFKHAGEARFDYLIGIAALDSGKPDKATLAFERALAVNPDFVAARLDMARAYYQLGDMPRAKTEFILVLRQNPPAAARANIEKYLDVIAEQEGNTLTRVTAYVEGAIGHDSNVNSSTSQSQIFVDGIGPTGTNVPLDPNSIKASDNYYGVAAGGEVTRKLNANWTLYAGTDIRQRGYHTQKSFDLLGVEARTGVMFGAKAEHLRIGVLGGRYNLGGSHNSDTAGFSAEWRHVFSPSNQLKIFGQYAQYRYADVAMQVNNYDQQAMGASWSHILADGKSMLFGSLYHGTENDVSAIITQATPDGGRADGARRFNGLRVGGQTALSDTTTLFVNAEEQIGNYSKVNPLFLRVRNDRLYDLTTGANWHLNKLWTLRPQLNYSRNFSSIAIYGYDRADVSLTVRRDFR